MDKFIKLSKLLFNKIIILIFVAKVFGTFVKDCLQEYNSRCGEPNAFARIEKGD